MKKKIEEIEYVHHYTTIENLALILSTRRIRFTRIDKVDDLKEIEGLPSQFGTYVYVSCWTHNVEENIALWKMYTNNMKGVRITLPVNMFKEVRCNINRFQIEESEEEIISPFENNEILTEDYCICNGFKTGWDFFDIVTYTQRHIICLKLEGLL